MRGEGKNFSTKETKCSKNRMSFSATGCMSSDCGVCLWE